MSKIQDNIIKLFNRIFRKNTTPMIASTTKENYDRYHKTYDTLSKIASIIKDLEHIS